MNNGRWQLAFWVITVIASVWLVSLTSGVISNDKARALEDKEIRIEIGTAKAERLLQYAEIIARLTRIETKLESQ